MDTAIAGLIGALIAGIGAVMLERIRWANEKAKLRAAMLAKPELQAARLQAYRDLWSCLGGISTRHPDDIASNLRLVQDRLQAWYYDQGGGLLLEGRADEAGSTKELFFAARDLSSTDPAEIWRVFHQLRRAVRHDIGVYEDSDAEERARLKAEALFKMTVKK